MLNLFKKKCLNENGFSMMELSVAVGIAAVIALVGVTASTIYLNNSNESSELYEINADNSILNAEQGYLEVVSGFWAKLVSELEDVLYSSETAVEGQGFFYNGEFWVSGNIPLEFLAGFFIDNPVNGETLIFDGTNWVNGTIPTPTVNDLTDVTFSQTISTGASLVFDGTSWTNGSAGKPGLIKVWSTSSAPEGWLIADGREVSRTTYAELFAAIGTTYGAGNGSTTFNLPDMRGKVAVGRDSADTDFNALGKTGGAKTHTLTVAEMPSHTHTQQPHSHTGSTNEAGAHDHDVTLANAGLHSHTVASTSAGSHQHQTPSRNVVRSIKTGTGNTGRALFSTWTTAGEDFWNHTHNYSLGSAGGHSHTVTLNSAGGHSHTLSLDNATAINNPAGGGEAHNNLQPYAVSHFIIKF